MDTTIKGYKTAGFWFGLAATALAAIVAGGSDLGPAASAVALAVSGLTAAGYAAFRAFKKSEDPKKPAWKTSEFWLSIAAAAVTGLYASGVIGDGGTVDKVIGVVAMLLGALGYSAVKPAKK
jgi:hypothetical protein